MMGKRNLKIEKTEYLTYNTKPADRQAKKLARYNKIWII
jgi:hypothetical protein